MNNNYISSFTLEIAHPTDLEAELKFDVTPELSELWLIDELDVHKYVTEGKRLVSNYENSNLFRDLDLSLYNEKDRKALKKIFPEFFTSSGVRKYFLDEVRLKCILYANFYQVATDGIQKIKIQEGYIDDEYIDPTTGVTTLSFMGVLGGIKHYYCGYSESLLKTLNNRPSTSFTINSQKNKDAKVGDVINVYIENSEKVDKCIGLYEIKSLHGNSACSVSPISTVSGSNHLLEMKFGEKLSLEEENEDSWKLTSGQFYFKRSTETGSLKFFSYSLSCYHEKNYKYGFFVCTSTQGRSLFNDVSGKTNMFMSATNNSNYFGNVVVFPPVYNSVKDNCIIPFVVMSNSVISSMGLAIKRFSNYKMYTESGMTKASTYPEYVKRCNDFLFYTFKDTETVIAISGTKSSKAKSNFVNDEDTVTEFLDNSILFIDSSFLDHSTIPTRYFNVKEFLSPVNFPKSLVRMEMFRELKYVKPEIENEMVGHLYTVIKLIYKYIEEFLNGEFTKNKVEQTYSPSKTVNNSNKKNYKYSNKIEPAKAIKPKRSSTRVIFDIEYKSASAYKTTKQNA